MRPVHPFPARMAPELAVAGLSELGPRSVVVDPMAGSGTVLRQAAELGLNAIGFDIDPLAVLMSSVLTTPVSDKVLDELAGQVLKSVAGIRLSEICLPWIDEVEETREFVKYWFATKQRNDLRKISFVLSTLSQRRVKPEKTAALNVLRIALSRIIVTKDQGASLARDVSHSRPHKVAEFSSFEVLPSFERSINYVRSLLPSWHNAGTVSVTIGDARSLRTIQNRTIDAVVTSPPYLNAIDYIRGHRLSLVWLGYGLAELRAIRANSIGAERGPSGSDAALFDDLRRSMCDLGSLPLRYEGMIMRYVQDVYRFMSEIARVLKVQGEATLVVGNSCLKGSFIRNSNAVALAATMMGLRLVDSYERDLPDRNRYLPLSSGALEKRMRTETILKVVRP
jgi:hypothetical protein